MPGKHKSKTEKNKASSKNLARGETVKNKRMAGKPLSKAVRGAMARANLALNRTLKNMAGNNSSAMAAIVEKALGSGRFEVRTIKDGVLHRVRLPKKFKISKGQARKAEVDVAIHRGSHVLTNGDEILAIIPASEANAILKKVGAKLTPVEENFFNRSHASARRSSSRRTRRA